MACHAGANVADETYRKISDQEKTDVVEFMKACTGALREVETGRLRKGWVCSSVVVARGLREDDAQDGGPGGDVFEANSLPSRTSHCARDRSAPGRARARETTISPA